MQLKAKLIKLHWILSTQMGFDPRILVRSILAFPYYIKSYLNFRKEFKGTVNFVPCLQDRFEESGATKNEYFWQDLVVAQKICKAKPTKHVDIGSRVDGFVAHLASFRDCEVFDVRANSSSIPGIIFRQADLMSKESLPLTKNGYCDSISCLHALEHFGLGRYGDPINVKGFQAGISNISSLLKLNGIFYLSTPIGEERVEFNANWIFDPRTIIDCAKTSGLTLSNMYVINSKGANEVNPNEETLVKLSLSRYELGLFVFKKKK